MIETPTQHRDIVREGKKSWPLHKWVAPYAFLDDHMILTKQGDLFTVLKLHGIDTECLDPDAIQRVCQRFEAALRILGPEYRVYQYLTKRSHPDLPTPGVNDALAQARAGWLMSRRAELYTIQLHLVILRMRPKTSRAKADFLSSFSMKRSLTMAKGELLREMQDLRISTESLAVQLADVVRPELLSQDKATQFLLGLTNLAAWKQNACGAMPDAHLDQYLCRSELGCWPDHLTMDEYRIKMLTMADPPAQSIPHMLRRMLQIPCSMVVCSDWNRIPNEQMNRELDRARDHYHSGLTKWKNFIWGKNPPAYEVLLDRSKESVIDVLDKAKQEILIKENFFGRMSYIIELFHESEIELRRAVARIIEVMGTYDAKVIEERYGMMKAWASMIPGNYAYELRPFTALNLTHADLAPALFSPKQGNPVNEHLKQPALIVLETEERTPYYFCNYVQDVGHTVLLGAVGSGKSFCTNALISGYQQYGAYTVIFDLGGSYRRLTNHYQGGYLHIGKESDVTINPFCLPPTKQNLDFLFGFVRVLIERKGYEMTTAERKDLHTQITNLYEMEPETRTLGTLALTVHRSYRQRLEEWVGEGRLSGYFDHPKDTLSFARFQAFDFEGMAQSEVLEPLLFYILHRANSNIYDPEQAAVPKLVVFDEAWRFFLNEVTRAYIHEALKTWRKRNAAVIITTQSCDDLAQSKLLPTITENCLTNIFLANPGMDQQVYRDAFNLNATEAEAISRLIPKRQLLVKQRPGGSKVLNLQVDPESYRVFANKG
jgi:type IV secretion/conjugal transfer VirB4 family ATPase